MKGPAVFLTAIIILLTACTQSATPDLAETTAQASLTPPAQVLTALAAPTKTPMPTPTSTLTNIITSTQTPTTTGPARTPLALAVPSSYLALLNAAELLPLGPSGMANLHGLILFRSQWAVPFASEARTEAETVNFAPLTRLCRNADGYGCLWAISPDGRWAGLISSRDFDFNLYLPPDGPPQLAENGFITNNPGIQQVRLPEVCSQDPNSDVSQRCDRIQFSYDGRFLGFRYGPDNCGRSMQVIDRQMGEIVLKIEGGVHGFGFLVNGKMALSTGHCEGGGIRFFDPLTRQMVKGGGYGVSVWNPSRTIEVVVEESYMSGPSGLWGYNLNTGTAFRPENSGMLYEEHAIFLRDGKRFIYQYLEPRWDKSSGITSFDTPAQIVRYDPISGQRTVLASDPAYHYRLCQFDYENPCSMQWYGDWIQVQRVIFTPLQPKGNEWDIDSLMPCYEKGQQCAVPPESFALNAHTGELRPWDPATLPLAYPTPTPTPGPDRLGKPIYTDPGGQFTFYVGMDGKSLWRLPKAGPAVKWVSSGEGFFYLP